MRVAIVGGKLQGVEAAYLAKKAGWEVILADKDANVPAAKCCDIFHHVDVTRVVEWISCLKGIDLVIPALENQEALASLVRSAKYVGVPLMFDEDAYAISSSKLISNELFARMGIPAPRPWPECGFPIIVKPSGASGSHGILKIENACDFQQLLKEKSLTDWVIEEYLDGPSYSLEVIGFAGIYNVLHITELHMDEIYDCKRVIGSPKLTKELKQQFEQIGLRLARSMKLNGIMDIETILHQGELKVLEIDARLPSQTPIAVYHATGVNMLEILGQAFVQNKPWQPIKALERKGAIYEHIRVSGERLDILGEHVMADAGPLEHYFDFFGADETLTNYAPGKTQWVATLIITGATHQAAWDQRCRVIQNIMKEHGIQEAFDIYPVLHGYNGMKRASGS